MTARPTVSTTTGQVQGRDHGVYWRSRRWWFVPALGLLLGALSACGGNNMAFRVDESVRITSPTTLSTVTLPLTVTWSAPVHVGAHWGLFVDGQPIAPGHSIRDVADDTCKKQPGCPDASYLNGRGVYLTTDQQVTIPAVPELGGTGGQAKHPVHTITLALMDASGHRVGDSYWTVEFRV